MKNKHYDFGEWEMRNYLLTQEDEKELARTVIAIGVTIVAFLVVASHTGQVDTFINHIASFVAWK